MGSSGSTFQYTEMIILKPEPEEREMYFKDIPDNRIRKVDNSQGRGFEIKIKDRWLRHGNWVILYNKKGVRRIMKGRYDKDLLQGIWRSYYINDNNAPIAISSEVSYKNGRASGSFTRYYITTNVSGSIDPVGKLKTKGQYRDGSEEGLWLHYYEDGRTKTKGSYISGKRHGKWEMYTSEGMLEFEGNYSLGMLLPVVNN